MVKKNLVPLELGSLQDHDENSLKIPLLLSYPGGQMDKGSNSTYVFLDALLMTPALNDYCTMERVSASTILMTPTLKLLFHCDKY